LGCAGVILPVARQKSAAQNTTAIQAVIFDKPLFTAFREENNDYCLRYRAKQKRPPRNYAQAIKMKLNEFLPII